MKVKHLRVPSKDLVLIREPVYARTEVPWITIIAKDLRISGIRLHAFRPQHGRALQLKSMVEDRRQILSILTLEIVQPTKVILPFHRKPAILECSVKAAHPPASVRDRDPWAE